jgi:hypothetical protein
MTQLEATGDTAKDIRAELADAAQNIRAELAEQERRLKDLHTRVALAATPAQLDERDLRLRETALQDRHQLQALEQQVAGQQEPLAQVASIAAQVESLTARLTAFESDASGQRVSTALPRFSPPNRASFGRGRENRVSFDSQGAGLASFVQDRVSFDSQGAGLASFVQDPVGEGAPPISAHLTVLAPGDVLGNYLERVNSSVAPTDQPVPMHGEARPEKLSVDTKHIPEECTWYGEHTMAWAAPGDHQKQGIFQFLWQLDQLLNARVCMTCAIGSNISTFASNHPPTGTKQQRSGLLRPRPLVGRRYAIGS